MSDMIYLCRSCEYYSWDENKQEWYCTRDVCIYEEKRNEL